MLKKFQTELGFNEEEANKLYEIAAKILCTEIKDKLMHPFRRQN